MYQSNVSNTAYIHTNVTTEKAGTEAEATGSDANVVARKKMNYPDAEHTGYRRSVR